MQKVPWGIGEQTAIQLKHTLETPKARSRAVAEVLKNLHVNGHIPGWRDELYPVAARFGAEPLLLVERAAAHLLGIKAYGVHVNGFVRRADGLHLWVARRSTGKPTWPGQLDHLAAGGQVCSPICAIASGIAAAESHFHV
jgi:hypothetical protein